MAGPAPALTGAEAADGAEVTTSAVTAEVVMPGVAATPAELHHRHQRSLLRLATLVSGDAGVAHTVVRDAFSRLTAARQPVDGDRALAGLRRAALAGPPRPRPTPTPTRPSLSLSDVCVERVLALPRHERDCVLLHCFLGLDQREVANTLRLSPRTARIGRQRGLRTLRTAGFDEPMVAVSLGASVADVEPADGGWEAVLAEVDRRDRRRRRLLLATGVPMVAVVVAIVALTSRAVPGETAVAQRIRVVPDGPPLPSLGLPPMPPVAIVLADRRIIQLDPGGTVSPLELGTLDPSGGPLTAGSVEVSATASEVHIGRDTGASAIIAFGGGWHGAVVATGHSPAISRDGASAWVEQAPAGQQTLVVSRGDGIRRVSVPAGSGTPVRVRSLSWSPSGGRLAVEVDATGQPPEVRIIDLSRDGGVAAGSLMATGRTPQWLPDGTLLVVDQSGTNVRIIDPDSGQSVARPINGVPALTVDIDSRGDMLVVHTDGVLTAGGRVLQSSVVAAAWQQ